MHYRQWIYFVMFCFSVPLFLPAIAYADQSTVVKQAFQLYSDALKTHDKSRVLAHLNHNSRNMMKNRPYGATMMANEVRNIKMCGDAYAVVQQNRAIIYFMTQKLTCNPYFMNYEHGAWRVDLHIMSRAIRFDQRNHWRFDRSVKHPYTFILK